MTRLLAFALLVLLSAHCAIGAQVHGVRLWSAPDHTRLVFDIDGPIEHKLFTLKNPARVVVDLKATRLATDISLPDVANRHLRGMRNSKRDNGAWRFALDLKTDVRPQSFLLRPQNKYGYRLVIDMFDREGSKQVTKSARDLDTLRNVVVAIDPGHGGDDPGAIGRKRTREKHVTLQIARRLKKLIDSEAGMEAVLTRGGDYYVGLRKRNEIARKHRADLFVSIHADAFKNKDVHGASVYVVSRRGASNEAARWLARRENSADLAGGVSLDDKDPILASVLIDLSQQATRQAGEAAAEKIFKELVKTGNVHGRRVQRAGFVVLKSPDIPSVLVEIGFISNPREERRLRDPTHQKSMAKAIFSGIIRHFKESPPEGTLLARRRIKPRKYVIQPGDTLSEIAQVHDVNLRALRKQNNLRGDRIRVGQVLHIPGG